MANPLSALLTESVVDLLTGQIRANFNTYLADIDNQYSDGINLEPIDSESFYITDKQQTVRPPAVYVLAGIAAFQYTDDPNYLESQDEFVVAVTCEDVGADRIKRKCWRYNRVMFETLNLVDLQTPDQRLKIKCIPKRLAATEPIATKVDSFGQVFRGDAVLELTVLHYEKNLT